MVETFPIINHNKEAIEDALAGNLEAIRYIFQWTNSSLRRDWVSIQIGGLKMDEEAKSYLRWLLKSDPNAMKTTTSTYHNDFRHYKRGRNWS